jgi:hypothetical protein
MPTPAPAPRASRVSRETRLLLLTVGLCAVVLLVLARWRFPDREEVQTTAPPLERLAARASYDALAADIQRVEPMIAPNLIVLRVAPQFPPVPHDLRDVLARADSRTGVRHVAALRISPDTALAAIEPGARIEGIVGGGPGATAAVVAVDPVRRIARLRVPEAPARQLAQLPLASLPTPAYVVVVEGTQAGTTLRPVFLGRSDRFASARWSRPLLPLGGIVASPGALLFSLAGEFIGTVVSDTGAPAIAGARDVLDTVERLAAADPRAPADLGLAVQPLTPALATALGVERGVVVADVDPDGPAAARLAAADVIVAVDGWSTDNPDEFLLRMAARAPGEQVAVDAVRGGKPVKVSVTLAAAATAVSNGAAAFSFATEPGVGTRVSAAPAGSGLQPGDVITRAGAIAAPTPTQLRRLLARPAATGFAVLVVRRDGRQQIVSVPVSPPGDAPR